MDGSYHPPMKIVLGALAGGTPAASSLTRNDYDECNDSSSSAVSYILGTSYFASPPASLRTHVGGGGGSGSGNSGGNHHRRHTTLGLNKDGRVPMADRKGPFDQFKPKSLILSVSDIYFCLGGEGGVSAHQLFHIPEFPLPHMPVCIAVAHLYFLNSNSQ